MANINISHLNKFNENSIMIHSADEKLAVDHIKFWVDIFSDCKQGFSILVRDENSYKKLVKEFPRLQICYAQNPVDVESVINAQSDLKIIFYTSNMAKNIHLLRFNHLKHVFIGTKNSEWLSHYNKSYRAYDEFWAGGDFVVNRVKEEIENTGHLQFKIVGKPQIKDSIEFRHNEKDSSLVLIDDNNELLLEQIYFTNKILNKKMYLYLSNEKDIIKKDLLNVAKSHNFINKLQIFRDKEMINDVAKRVSLIITDLKNINPYLLQYKVPLIVYIESEYDKYLINIDLLRESIYYFSNKNELVEVLTTISTDDFLKDKREKALNEFFNQEAISKNIFLETLQFKKTF